MVAAVDTNVKYVAYTKIQFCFQDSFGILDITDPKLEDESFPNDLCDISAASGNFVSSEFELNECNNLQKTHPTETSPSPPPPPPSKRKARPSLQALIDKYYAIKGNKLKEEDIRK